MPACKLLVLFVIVRAADKSLVQLSFCIRDAFAIFDDRAIHNSFIPRNSSSVTNCFRSSSSFRSTFYSFALCSYIGRSF